MQKALRVEMTAVCDFKFEYGSQSDGIRWFAFHTGEGGYGAYSMATPYTTNLELYCSKVGSAGSGMTVECSFPAW
jgi:hypothetical protein